MSYVTLLLLIAPKNISFDSSLKLFSHSYIFQIDQIISNNEHKYDENLKDGLYMGRFDAIV